MCNLLRLGQLHIMRIPDMAVPELVLTDLPIHLLQQFQWALLIVPNTLQLMPFIVKLHKLRSRILIKQLVCECECMSIWHLCQFIHHGLLVVHIALLNLLHISN